MRQSCLRFRRLVVLQAVAVAAALGATASMAQERVSFPSLDADLTGGKPTTIDARLFRPKGDGPFPAVIAMHGCGGLFAADGRSSNRSRPSRHKPRPPPGGLSARHADWASRLSALGYVVLMPDSFGPRGLQEICTIKDRPVSSRRHRPRDAYGALLWLQSRPFVKPDKVALMGWSNGGSTVLHSISRRSEARPEQLPHGDFRAAIAFYPGCPDPAKSKVGRSWRTRVPLVILSGAADDWTPIAPCERLAAKAAERRDDVALNAYPGAYHGFDSPDNPVHVRTGLATAQGNRAHVGTDRSAREDALKRVPEFLRSHLGG